MKLLEKTVGILGFLGTFRKHKEMLDKLGVANLFVRNLKDLDAVDALIIPGTEIASLHFALKELLPEIKKRIEDKMPLLLTGESCILLSEDEKTEISWPKMVIQSFTKDNKKDFSEKLRLGFSDTKDFEAHFVRSPRILRAAKGFEILAEKSSDGEEAVIIENNDILACTFYPELGKDERIHEYFVTKI